MDTTIDLDDDVSLAVRRMQRARGLDSASEVLRRELDLAPDASVEKLVSSLPEELRAAIVVADETTTDCKYVRDVDQTVQTILYREPVDERVMLELTIEDGSFTVRGLDAAGSMVDVAGGRAEDGQVTFWTAAVSDVEADDVVTAFHEHCKQTYRTWAFQEPWLSGCGVAKWKGLKID